MVQLGKTVFDLSAQMLRDSAGAKIALRAQSSRVLECLIDAKGALVTKDHLFKTVWPDVSVTDDSLVQCIREIRNAINDPDHSLLQTEARRGYRLVTNGHDKTGLNGTVAIPAAFSPSSQNSDGQITPAIAVMAFTSMDGDERSERLAMTFAGDLITELARHKELRVIGRFSSFSLKGQALSSKEVCEKLNARYIVSGQVQFTETTIDWSLEMMDGYNDEIVWTERKQVKFTDIYTETAELFWRIAGTIHANFKIFTQKLSIARSPDTLNAYDLCARSSAAITQISIEGTLEAQRLATQAITQYPEYARAWRALAMAHLWDIVHSHTGHWGELHIPQALKEVHKAIELDATQASAYGVLANLLTMNGQPVEALIASERAMQLAPSDPTMLNIHAVILFFAGRFEESKALSESLITIGPLRQSAFLAAYGRTLFALGENKNAINLLEETLTFSPGTNTARVTLVAAYEEAGRHTEAAKHYSLLLTHSNGFNANHFGYRWIAIPQIRARCLAALQTYGLESEVIHT
jgi:adenylate cyclase